MKTEQTFVMVKPDGVQRRLVGTIIKRFEGCGLKLVAMKFIHASHELAASHYAIHKGKPFYGKLLTYIISGPVVTMVWEGNNAIERVRKIVGATNPHDAIPGTIRGDFCQHIGRNAIHASDSPETAAKEIDLWFSSSELVIYDMHDECWIYE